MGARWAPAVLAVALLLCGILPTFLVASVAVRIRTEFPLSDSLIGLGIGITFAVAAIASPVAGRVIDRVGVARGMIAGGSLAVVCPLAIALVAYSAATLILPLVLCGLALALSAPGGGALIAQAMDPARRGLAFGMQQAGAPAGALLAGLALPLIAAPFGWRAAFVAAAGLAALVVVLVSTLSLGGFPGGPAEGDAPPRLRQLREVNLATVATTLATGVAVAVMSFLVVFAVEDAGFSEGPAGFLLAATSLSSIAARIVLGVVADRRPGGTLAHVGGIVMVGAIGLVLLATAKPLAVVAGAIIVGGIGWSWTGLMILVLVRGNPGAPATTIGVAMVGVFAGTAGGPMVVGMAAEALSFRVAWLAAAALAAAAAALFVFTTRMAARPESISAPKV